MNKTTSNKFVMNFIKNSLHKVESFFSVGNENVVFTEDSKCFPINEVEIIELNTLTKCLKKTLTKDMVMEMWED
jgi:hypothetical protein